MSPFCIVPTDIDAFVPLLHMLEPLLIKLHVLCTNVHMAASTSAVVEKCCPSIAFSSKQGRSESHWVPGTVGWKSRSSKPKLDSLETMTQSVYIPLSTNLPSSSRSAVAVTYRIKISSVVLSVMATNRLFDGGCHMKHNKKPPMLYRAEAQRGVKCFVVSRKWKIHPPLLR